MAANQAFRDLTAAAAQAPGSLTKGNQANSILAVATKGDEVLKEIGASGDYGSLRAGAKAKLQSSISGLKVKANQLSETLKEMVNPTAGVDAKNSLGFVNAELTKLGGDVTGLSELEREILTALTPKKGAPGEADVLPTVARLEAIKRKVGKATQTNSPYTDIDKGRADKLYELLSEDYKSILKPGSPELAVFEQRNAAVKIRKGLEKESQDLFGKKLSANLITQIKRVTQGLTSGGDDAFVKTMQAIPDEYRQEAAAQSVRMMFGKLKADGSLDIATFSKFWDGLKANPRSYAALASNLPKDSVQKFESLNRLSKAVTAKPGESVDAVKQRIINAETLMEKLSDFSSRFLSRAGAEVGTSAIGLHGVGAMWAMTRALSKSNNHLLKATDELLASPELAHTMKNLSNENSKIAIKKLTMSKAFKAFKKAFGNPKELDKFDEMVLQAIQAASRPNREEL